MSSEPDFITLAVLARYHARKQRGTYLVSYFDRTGDAAALVSAKSELQAGLEIWQRLIEITGVYPSQMAYGPDDVGHWRDKLPYVKYDLALVAEREDILKRFGKFDAAFDFGGPVKKQPRYGAYREDAAILANTVEPRFTAVDPSSAYTEESGFGWLPGGEREAVAIPLTPYREMRAVAHDPQNLPHDRLFRDYIRGSGAQQFALKADPGEYRVLLLHPDGAGEERKIAADNGRLTIPFTGAWSVSGIVVKGSKPTTVYPPPTAAGAAARPVMRHSPPATAQAGAPLSLALDVSGAGVRSIKIYYHAVKQLAEFKVLEAAPGARFTIPAGDISARWDLMYYFEVLNDRKSGWFQPDPLQETPYYVVKVVPGS